MSSIISGISRKLHDASGSPDASIISGISRKLHDASGSPDASIISGISRKLHDASGSPDASISFPSSERKSVPSLQYSSAAASTPSVVATSTELVPYLRLSDEELVAQDGHIRAMLTLLDPKLAHFFARPFIIGKNELLLYGQPLAMMTQSGLIAKLAENISSLATEKTIILSEQAINQDNAAAFVAIWMMLNGSFPYSWLYGKVVSRYSLQDIIFMLAWMSFFDIKVDFEGYRNVENALLDRLREGRQLTSAEHDRLSKLYETLLHECSEKKKRTRLCNEIETIATALAVPIPTLTETSIVSGVTRKLHATSGSPDTTPLHPVTYLGSVPYGGLYGVTDAEMRTSPPLRRSFSAPEYTGATALGLVPTGYPLHGTISSL